MSPSKNFGQTKDGDYQPWIGEYFIHYYRKNIQKLILQNHIFKDVNIDKLLEYNVFVS